MSGPNINIVFSEQGAKQVLSAVDRIAASTKGTVNMLGQLQRSLNQLNAKGATGITEQFKKTATATQQLETKVRQLEAANIKLQTQMKSVSSGQNNVAASTAKAEKGFRNLIPHVAAVTLSYMAMRRATQAVIASLKAGVEFEHQMAIVGGIVRATGKDLDMLTAAARKAGETTVWTATESAQALRYLGMAGFNAAESMTALPAVLNLALIGELDLGRATDIATDTLRAFGLQADELSRVVDVFTATITRSNTNVESMGQAMKYVAPVAAQLGYSVEETAAMIGILSQSGIKAGIAGRALRMSFLKSIEAADQLGLSTINLLDILKELAKTVDSKQELATALKDMFGLRSAPAMMVLMENMEALEKFIDINEHAAGETDKFIERLKTTQVEFRLLKSVITDVAIEAFNQYSDTLKEVLISTRIYIKEHRDDLVGLVQQIKDTFAPIGGLIDIYSALGDVLESLGEVQENIREKLTPPTVNTSETVTALKNLTAEWENAYYTIDGMPIFPKITYFLRALADGLHDGADALRNFSNWIIGRKLFATEEELNKQSADWKSMLSDMEDTYQGFVDKQIAGEKMLLEQRQKTAYSMIEVYSLLDADTLSLDFVQRQKAIDDYMNSFKEKNKDMLESIIAADEAYGGELAKQWLKLIEQAFTKQYDARIKNEEQLSKDTLKLKNKFLDEYENLNLTAYEKQIKDLEDARDRALAIEGISGEEKKKIIEVANAQILTIEEKSANERLKAADELNKEMVKKLKESLATTGVVNPYGAWQGIDDPLATTNLENELKILEKFNADKLKATQDLYNELEGISGVYYTAQIELINQEYNEYIKALGLENIAYENMKAEEKALFDALNQWKKEKTYELYQELLINFGGFTGGMVAYFREAQHDWENFNSEFGQLGYDTFEKLGDGFEQTFSKVLKGDLDEIGDLWKSLLNDMLDSFIDMISKMIRTWLSAEFGKMFEGSFSVSSLTGESESGGGLLSGILGKAWGGIKSLFGIGGASGAALAYEASPMAYMSSGAAAGSMITSAGIGFGPMSGIAALGPALGVLAMPFIMKALFGHDKTPYARGEYEIGLPSEGGLLSMGEGSVKSSVYDLDTILSEESAYIDNTLTLFNSAFGLLAEDSQETLRNTMAEKYKNFKVYTSTLKGDFKSFATWGEQEVETWRLVDNPNAKYEGDESVIREYYKATAPIYSTAGEFDPVNLLSPYGPLNILRDKSQSNIGQSIVDAMGGDIAPYLAEMVSEAMSSGVYEFMSEGVQEAIANMGDTDLFLADFVAWSEGLAEALPQMNNANILWSDLQRYISDTTAAIEDTIPTITEQERAYQIAAITSTAYADKLQALTGVEITAEERTALLEEAFNNIIESMPVAELNNTASSLSMMDQIAYNIQGTFDAYREKLAESGVDMEKLNNLRDQESELIQKQQDALAKITYDEIYKSIDAMYGLTGSASSAVDTITTSFDEIYKSLEVIFGDAVDMAKWEVEELNALRFSMGLVDRRAYVDERVGGIESMYGGTSGSLIDFFATASLSEITEFADEAGVSLQEFAKDIAFLIDNIEAGITQIEAVRDEGAIQDLIWQIGVVNGLYSEQEIAIHDITTQFEKFYTSAEEAGATAHELDWIMSHMAGAIENYNQALSEQNELIVADVIRQIEVMNGVYTEQEIAIQNLTDQFDQFYKSAEAAGATEAELAWISEQLGIALEDLIQSFNEVATVVNQGIIDDVKWQIEVLNGAYTEQEIAIHDLFARFDQFRQTAIDAGASEEMLIWISEQFNIALDNLIESFKEIEQVVEQIVDQGAIDDIAWQIGVINGAYTEQEIAIHDLTERFNQFYKSAEEAGASEEFLAWVMVQLDIAIANTAESVEQLTYDFAALRDQIHQTLSAISDTFNPATASQLMAQITGLQGGPITPETLQQMSDLLVQWYRTAEQEAQQTHDNQREVIDLTSKLIEKIAGLVDQVESAISNIKYSDLNISLPREKADAAAQDYTRLYEAAQAGGSEEIQEYLAFASTYLQQAQAEYKSSQTYQGIYAEVMANMEAVKAELETGGYDAKILAELQTLNTSTSSGNTQRNVDLSHLQATFLEMEEWIYNAIDELEAIQVILNIKWEETTGAEAFGMLMELVDKWGWENKVTLTFISEFAGNWEFADLNETMTYMGWIAAESGWESQAVLTFASTIAGTWQFADLEHMMTYAGWIADASGGWTSNATIRFMATMISDGGYTFENISDYLTSIGITDTVIHKTMQVQLLYDIYAQGNIDANSLADWVFAQVLQASLGPYSEALPTYMNTIIPMGSALGFSNAFAYGEWVRKHSAQSRDAGWGSVTSGGEAMQINMGYYGAPLAWAEGGIVTSPTFGVVGEAGYPEAVIPMKDGYNIPVKWIDGGHKERPLHITVEVAGKEFETDVKAWADEVRVTAHRTKNSENRRLYT